MTRKPTPDILAAPTPAPTYDLAAAMTATAPAPPLRYDYAALGAAGPAIAKHAQAIKRAEGRMAEETVEAGNHLIAVKESMPHGHWLPWLADEFGMSEDAAQRMMQVARRFGSNTDTLRYLSPTVLGLLSSPSVPDAAVEAAIAAAAASPVSVTAAKAIIAQHRPARCRICHRTLTDPTAAANGIGACCAARLAAGNGAGYTEADAVEDRPLPEWAQEPATIAQTVADVVEVYGEAQEDVRAVLPEFPSINYVPAVPPDLAPHWMLKRANGQYWMTDGFHATVKFDTPDAAFNQARKQQATWSIPLPPAANATPAPASAPPQGDSDATVVAGADERAEALGRLATWLEMWIEELRDVAQKYGELTGDFTTPVEVRRGLERMQVKVQVNQGDGGWE